MSAKPMLKIVLNGEVVAVESETSIDSLVASRAPSTKGVAVAVNAEVVPKSMWQSTFLCDGDRVELLTAAQGG